MFKRTYLCITPEIFKTLYKIFIRPKLEYASIVWFPYLKSDIIRLEKIQRRATRCVKYLSHLPYMERMRSFGLICLKNKRIRADLIFTWKLLNGVRDFL